MSSFMIEEVGYSAKALAAVINTFEMTRLYENPTQYQLRFFGDAELPGRPVSDYPSYEVAWLRASDGSPAFHPLGLSWQDCQRFEKVDGASPEDPSPERPWYWEVCQVHFHPYSDSLTDEYVQNESFDGIDRLADRIEVLLRQANREEHTRDLRNQLEIPFDDSDAGSTYFSPRVHYCAHVGERGLRFQLAPVYVSK